jgi:hypothetical protein
VAEYPYAGDSQAALSAGVRAATDVTGFGGRRDEGLVTNEQDSTERERQALAGIER